ncbi:MAG: restriction endonuclease [Bacteroidetes bacterium]|nr:restriction endonuclease [Bacteroidota bacterium]MBL7083770.1 restriction endonuclease [Candidatus Aminicenantes bacterium]
MTPDQYEKFVADYFRNKKYEVEETSYTNDYGVDAFAKKDGGKIAIQAKMYGDSSRKINRQMVMEFYGAKDYFDCDKGIIVTDGVIIDNAKDVAAKLGIEVLFLSPSNLDYESKKTEFDEIWENHIKPLEGKTIYRDNGKTNKIIRVDSGCIERETSNGNRQKIDIEIFKKTINHIFTFGSITRQKINDEYSKRASSGIVLILGQLPMFFLNTKRPMSIELVSKA